MIMFKGTSLHIKHLATSLLASSYSLVLIIDQIEGFPLGFDFGKKKGEDVKDINLEIVVCVYEE